MIGVINELEEKNTRRNKDLKEKKRTSNKYSRYHN